MIRFSYHPNYSNTHWGQRVTSYNVRWYKPAQRANGTWYWHGQGTLATAMQLRVVLTKWPGAADQSLHGVKLTEEEVAVLVAKRLTQ